MITKLTTKNKDQTIPFKPKIYLGKGEVMPETIIMTEVDSKIEIGQIAEKD